MFVYRLTRPDYAPGLDGLGARRHGGRWNSPGHGAVYCAGSLALAALEVFVHLPPAMRSPEKLPRLTAVTLSLPDDLDMTLAHFDDLPAHPATEDFRGLGNDWLEQGATAVLSVPSLVIPLERNFVLNPEHSDMAQVEVVDQLPFVFDPRIGTG